MANLFNYFKLNPFMKREEPVSSPEQLPKYVSKFTPSIGMGDVKIADRAVDEILGDSVIASEEVPVELPASRQIEENPFLQRFVPSQTEIDVGRGTLATDVNLKEAQSKRSANELINRLGKSAELIGAGFGRTKPVAQALFDDNIKAASRPVQELEERIMLEKKDPNSPYSKGFREYLQRFGVNITGDFSAEQGEKMVPWALQQYNTELSRQTQKDIASHNLAERKREFDLRSEDLKLRKSEQEDRRKTANDFKTETQISNLRKETTQGEMGKLYANYQQAVRAEKSLSDFAKNPTGYTDYGTLMLALKTLQGDQSVVREAEIRLGRNATDLFTKATNAIQRGIDGKSLKDKQRQDMIQAIQILGQAAKGQYITATRPIYEQAKRRELPLTNIFEDPAAYENVMPQQIQPSTIEKITMIHPETGRKGLVPKTQLEAALKQGYKLVK